jgi:hypothetical protein
MRKINLLLLIAVLGVAVFGYLQVKKYNSPPLAEENVLVAREEDTSAAQEERIPLVNDVMTRKPETIDVFDNQPAVELADVSGGIATGQAWTVIVDDTTFHKVIAQDLPVLTNDDFYEGWLVRETPTLDFFSTGKMIYDDKTKEWILEYEVVGDKSDYAKTVITLEPDDGDPAPAKHIIE